VALRKNRKLNLVGAPLLLSINVFGQMAQQYRQAANVWRNAACSVPVEQSCANQNAAYYDCLANQLGPSGASLRCSAPSCSVASCGGGGSSTSAGTNSSPDIPFANTGNAKADLVMNGIGLLLKWKMTHDANKNASPNSEPPTSAVGGASTAATESADAELKRERLNDEASQLLAEANSYAPAPESALPLTLDAASTIGALLDSPPPPSNSNVASQIGGLLDTPDSAPAMGTSIPGGSVAALLDSPVPANPMTATAPVIPSIQDLDNQEVAQANSLGQDWGNALSQVKDAALNQLKSQLDPVNILDSKLPNDDYLKSGAEATIKDLLPETSESEVTLGSFIQDKAVGIASDKVADTLTETKDQLACSGQNSEVDRAGCMVLMTPTNLARGLYNSGKMLVDRAGVMMDEVNQVLQEPSAK
jgi:hypothetical protein